MSRNQMAVIILGHLSIMWENLSSGHRYAFHKSEDLKRYCCRGAAPYRAGQSTLAPGSLSSTRAFGGCPWEVSSVPRAPGPAEMKE
jgi:hypothetical protein